MDAKVEIVDELVGNAHGNLTRVREILDEHPEAIHGSASWEETPIEAATQMADLAIIDLLVSRGAPVDFFTALVLGRLDMVDKELANPQRANSRGVHDLPALYFAAIGGNLTVAERLMAAGADVNARAEAAAPIHGAVMGGSAQMIRFLLQHGADASLPDYRGRDARTLAKEMNRPQIEKIFD